MWAADLAAAMHRYAGRQGPWPAAAAWQLGGSELRGLLLTDLADEECAHAGASAATQGVADLEPCSSSMPVSTLHGRLHKDLLPQVGMQYGI